MCDQRKSDESRRMTHAVHHPQARIGTSRSPGPAVADASPATPQSAPVHARARHGLSGPKYAFNSVPHNMPFSHGVRSANASKARIRAPRVRKVGPRAQGNRQGDAARRKRTRAAHTSRGLLEREEADAEEDLQTPRCRVASTMRSSCKGRSFRSARHTHACRTRAHGTDARTSEKGQMVSLRGSREVTGVLQAMAEHQAIMHGG